MGVNNITVTGVTYMTLEEINQVAQSIIPLVVKDFQHHEPTPKNSEWVQEERFMISRPATPEEIVMARGE